MQQRLSLISSTIAKCTSNRLKKASQCNIGLFCMHQYTSICRSTATWIRAEEFFSNRKIEILLSTFACLKWPLPVFPACDIRVERECSYSTRLLKATGSKSCTIKIIVVSLTKFLLIIVPGGLRSLSEGVIQACWF